MANGNEDEIRQLIEQYFTPGATTSPSGRATTFAPTDIPGVSNTADRSRTQRIPAASIDAIQQLLPFYLRTLEQQRLPTALSQLETQRAISDPTNQLALDLYQKFGPEFSKVGNEIAQQDALAQVARDRAVMAGGGRELAGETLDLAKMFDPEFFATRGQTASEISKLFSDIDLEGGLSESERREIEQGLAREGNIRGTTHAPSSTETVSNAMRYGEAGRQRKLQERSALSDAITRASAFLPASRTGMDSFQVATGRSAGPNAGAGQFGGVVNPSNATAEKAAGDIFGLSGNYTSGKLLARDAAEKDWLDKFEQFSSGLANTTSFIGGVAGAAAMCWVAREVYGANNPTWLTFRNWLFTDAPYWLFNMYAKHGEKFAKFIKNKPIIKKFIKHLMDKITQR